MRRILAAAVLGMTAACGGGSGGSPTSPTTPNPPAAVTGTLSGTITSARSGALAGATVRVLDGPNAGRSATADGSGRYSLTDLATSGFTVEVTAAEHVTMTRGVTVSPTSLSVTANFSLLPSELWTHTGGRNTVFDMPRYVRRVHIFGRWDRRGTSNFIVYVDGALIVNAILRDTNPYEGVHQVRGGVTEIRNSDNIAEWRFTEVR